MLIFRPATTTVDTGYLAQSLGTCVTVDTGYLAQSLGTCNGGLAPHVLGVTVDTWYLAQSLGTGGIISRMIKPGFVSLKNRFCQIV